MKRMTIKFMALALLMVAGTASVFAQGVAFTSTSLPRQMRQEGITEVAGEIQLTALTAGTIQDGSSIDVVFSTPITNNATGDAVNANININNNIVCTGPAAPVSSTLDVSCDAGVGQTMTAQLVGSTTLRISFPSDVVFEAGDRIVIARVRVNASAAVGVGSITATMAGSSSQPATFPITFTDPQRQVGVLNPTISVRFNSTTTPVLFLQTCVFPNTGAAVADVNRFRIRIDEVFPAALTTDAQETAAAPLRDPTNGVKLTITLTGVPAGVVVNAPALVTSTDFQDVPVNITANMISTPTTSVTQTVANTPIVFEYTVDNSNTALLERLLLNFFFKADTTSSTNPIALPSLGTSANIQATVTVSPVTTTDSTIVRFAPNAVGPTTVATVSDCNTRILMTWVATVADVETGIAISNTSSDDAAFGSGTALGATSQNGTCTLTGYPSAGGTPVSFTTATINAGASLPFLLSATTGFSNFTGYVLTVCNFQTAHAFTFITNGRGTVTGPTLAQGYVANIIPGGTRPAGGATEALGN
jgi:hypothetical protein